MGEESQLSEHQLSKSQLSVQTMDKIIDDVAGEHFLAYRNSVITESLQANMEGVPLTTRFNPNKQKGRQQDADTESVAMQVLVCLGCFVGLFGNTDRNCNVPRLQVMQKWIDTIPLERRRTASNTIGIPEHPIFKIQCIVVNDDELQDLKAKFVAHMNNKSFIKCLGETGFNVQKQKYTDNPWTVLIFDIGKWNNITMNRLFPGSQGPQYRKPKEVQVLDTTRAEDEQAITAIVNQWELFFGVNVRNDINVEIMARNKKHSNSHNCGGGGTASGGAGGAASGGAASGGAASRPVVSRPVASRPVASRGAGGAASSQTNDAVPYTGKGKERESYIPENAVAASGMVAASFKTSSTSAFKVHQPLTKRQKMLNVLSSFGKMLTNSHVQVTSVHKHLVDGEVEEDARLEEELTKLRQKITSFHDEFTKFHDDLTRKRPRGDS